VAGKKTSVVKNLIETLLSILTSYTAGNPMDCDVLWTNLTLKQIQEKLRASLISVSCPVIKKLLKSCHFVKRKMRKTKTLKDVENRNEQFEYIAKKRKQFIDKNLPVLSIDTKKKELIGSFFRQGKAFCKKALGTLDHDFPSFAKGIAVPHGIYDLAKNTCYLSIGTNKDTAEFVKDNIEYHWNHSIKKDYPNAKKMLILCDGGGSNSSSYYVVKEQLKGLAEKLRMQIVVAHYPPYCSKWNPIEHKAFSYISKKWEGYIFENHEIMKESAEQTTTKTGFSVKAYINTKIYQTGKKASDEFMRTMPVFFYKFLPKWNYKFDYKK
jgi:hypothetical protein